MIFQKDLIESLNLNGTRVAIEDADRKLTYQQVLDAANVITSFLREQGVEQQDFIGIQVKDRVDLIISMVGVANARGVFVPINGVLPESRLVAMAEDLDLKYVITSKTENVSALMKGKRKPVCFFIEDILDISSNSTTKSFQYPEFQPDDSLYVYFTSGTTGKPKGIIGKNESLLHFLRWEIREFRIDNSLRVSQFISPYFDAFLRDVFVPLMAGGTVVIPPAEEDFFTPARMTSWIDEKQINLIHCVPSLFAVINHDQINKANYKSLKYVLLSGEKLIPSKLSGWYTIFDSAIQLVNLYGATETTMIRSCYHISPKDVSLPKMPIGSPIADTEFVIANDEFKPCGKLVPGELYIISKYVTKGYLNRPDLNSQKFRPVKTEKLGDVIAFKTGDKARILANGHIDLLGREDRQVKVRGIRIELDEIEHILNQSELVKNVVVIKNENERGDESLCAFAIPAGIADNSGIEDYAKRHLPDYMMPALIKLVNEMPLLPNGKIDYHTLLKSTEESVVVAPSTPIEHRLLAIWKEILGEKEISTNQSFHALGGSSLSIMRLISRIYSEFQVRIPLSEIFKNLTIAKQGRIIENLKKDKALEIQKTPAKEGYVLSSSQDRIYFHYLLNPMNTAFNIPMVWEMNGKVDERKIQDTLQALVARHETFRTIFESREGQLRQVVNETVEFKIEKYHTTEDQLDDAITSFVRPFNLGNAPLLRAAIITADDRKILAVDTHHIVCDGMSQANLFSEFSSLYAGVELKPLELQYKDYAEWESSFRKTDEYIHMRSYWLNNFDGRLPVLQLPTQYKGETLHALPGRNIYFQISKRELDPVLSALKSQEVSAFSGLFAMFYLFLAKITGQDDIIIGTNTAGRIQEKLEGIVGMFVKTLPIRFCSNVGQKFFSFSKEMHELLIQANSRQIYDLSDIVRDLNRSRETPVTNLIDVMFVYQNFDIKDFNTSELIFSPYKVEHNTAKYPITMIVSEDAENFYFKLEYSTLHFTKDEVQLLIENYKNVMLDISSNPERQLLDLLEDVREETFKLEEDIKFDF